MKRYCLILVFVLLFAACQKPEIASVSKFSSESRPQFGFRWIDAGGTMELVVTIGGEYSVTVEGESAILKELTTKSDGETLTIRTSNKIDGSNRPRVKITTPELSALVISGATTASVSGITANLMKLQAAGSSRLVASGRTSELKASAIGSSTIDAEKLKSENAVVKCTGASNVTLDVSGKLEAESLGASTIYFIEEPREVVQSITGAGEIRQK
ncbi:MAG TPA: DUF2807 domain-containing protein [Pyrinomonadaceae bacterium]|nr:DUF2807 domain-containing protein [Pyrinomonadaceae bacterium]